MAKTANSIGKTLIWILLALLIVGLMGFGATNFSGTVRSVGSVGDAEMDINGYARALQNEIRALEQQAGGPVTFVQAQAMGVPERTLAQMVVTAALEHEAGSMGISIGDERLAQELRNIPSFQGPDGQFNRDAYAFALNNAGLSEAAFEEDLRAESATTLLQGAVLAGTRMPETYIETLIGYAGELRSFTWAELPQTGLSSGTAVPTEDQLVSWYGVNIAQFTLPETKDITYAWLTPEMIIDKVEVDEDQLREAYEERSAEFNLPARRLVERLVFPDAEKAQEAADKIAAGEISFEDAVASRGLELADTDLGDVTQKELGAAGETVFAAESGSVVGPAQSDFGPALFRINAVLPAQSTPFEDAEPALRDELALDRARRVIDAQVQELENELAAGATLEELAQATDLQLGEISWHSDSHGDIAGYDAFREAAAKVTDRDFPTIEGLGDGGIFAIRLNAVHEAAAQPFDEVRDAVVAGWESDQRSKAKFEEAEAIAAEIKDGASFADKGLTETSVSDVTRNAADGNRPAGMVARAFELAPGDIVAFEGDETAYILRLDTVTKADPESETSTLLRQIYGEQASGDVAQDLFRALASDIQSRAGVEINQEALNAVHANFQ